MISFTDAIGLATDRILATDDKAIMLGLGVNYESGPDGTAKGLARKYPGRLIDTPVSEASFTGMAVGAAAAGLHPIVHHGRVEFALFAADQIVTQAAKWNYMFGGDYPCPIVLRICIGRQWGNGPQHTTGLHSLFAQLPGVLVTVPSCPEDAYRCLIQANRQQRPAIYLEHRWLYKTKQPIDVSVDRDPEPVRVEGEDSEVCFLTYGDGFVEALLAQSHLRSLGIASKVINVVEFSALPDLDISGHLKKCRQLFIIDSGTPFFGVASELVKLVTLSKKSSPPEIGMVTAPFEPVATSLALSESHYPNCRSVLEAVFRKLGMPMEKLPEPLGFDQLHLPPNYEFR